MDIFRLLSRGANIERKGKHKEELDIFKQPEVSGGTEKSNEDFDFFKTSARNERREHKQRERALPEENNDEEEGEHGEHQISISTKEEAQKLRQKHKIKVTGDDLPLPIGSFTDLTVRFNLHSHLLRNLRKADFDIPTAIQSEAIPILLNGRDLIACAPTGSGKTLAFAIPLIQQLKEHKTVGFRALIISPTKELATQIYNECYKLSRGRDLSVCMLSKSQAAKFKHSNKQSTQKFDVLITTPLRLVECIKQGLVDLKAVEYLVFDEADKLFEQGFVEQTDDILSSCTNPKLKRAMFSATIPSGVEKMAQTIMLDPVRVIVGHKEGASTDIEQNIVYTGNEEGKLVAIRQMITAGEIKPPVIIFVQSIQRAKALFHELVYDKLNVDVIHGERTATKRDSVIERFRNGDIWILICTDVLSRGIDFRGVNLVINYDIPQTPQSYVHRIGRTGRAGRQGKAVTFYTKDDREAVTSIVNVMKQSGVEVAQWLENLPKMGARQKKSLKRKPIDRNEISTVPKAIREKNKQKKEIILASKRRRQQEQVS